MVRPIVHIILHSYMAIGVYLAMTAIPKARFVGMGLVIHMVLDGLDCIWMVGMK